MAIPMTQTTCVGISVRKLNGNIQPKFITKESKSKIHVGVPFQGAYPFETIREYLLENKYVEKDDLLGNIVFLGEYK